LDGLGFKSLGAPHKSQIFSNKNKVEIAHFFTKPIKLTLSTLRVNFFDIFQALFLGFFRPNSSVAPKVYFPNQTNFKIQLNISPNCYNQKIITTTKINLSSALKLTLGFKGGLLIKITQIIFNIFLLVCGFGLLLYLFNVVFYRSGLPIPEIFNFNLVGLTAFIFSLISSEVFLEKTAIKFLMVYMGGYYNSIESSTKSLKFQEKYFLKYENTYFLDKKCGEE
jgi:hypothetical protein